MYAMGMTKMSKAQRDAIIDTHQRRLMGNAGLVFARAGTMRVLRREGWMGGAFDQPTRAGLIAAGVDMDAIHAEALTENDRQTAIAAAEDSPRGHALIGAIVEGWTYRSALDVLHAAALIEDFERTQMIAGNAPAHVRDDCPALPVGCRRCTAPMTIRTARAEVNGWPDPYAGRYFAEYPMGADELRALDPRRTMTTAVLRSTGVLDNLHAEALL